ncbi:MAG: hypothetical protein RSF67_07970 [Clostridia bacterium]
MSNKIVFKTKDGKEQIIKDNTPKFIPTYKKPIIREVPKQLYEIKR